MLMGSPDNVDLSMSPTTDPERERDGVEINRGRVCLRFLLVRLEYIARENNAAWEFNAFQEKKKDRFTRKVRKFLNVYRCHIFGNSLILILQVCNNY